MENTEIREVDAKERVREFCVKNSDLPEKVVNEMLNTNKSGFDTKTLDYIEKEETIHPNEVNNLMDGLTLVHLTNYPPEDGNINPRSELKDKTVARKHRSTVHMSLSYSVTSHGRGDWTNSEYMVLCPMGEVKNQAVGYDMEDVYLAGPVKTSENFLIRKTDKKEKGEVSKYLIERGIIDRSTFFDLVSNNLWRGDVDLKNYLNKICNSEWVVDLDEVRRNLDENHPLYESISKLEKLTVSRFIESPSQFIVVAEMIRTGKIPLFRGIKEEKDIGSIFVNGISRSDIDESKYENIDKALAIKINGDTNLHDHAGSIWYALERLPDIAINGGDSIIEFNPMLKSLASEKDRTTRLQKAVNMVKKGGGLWKSFVGKYILKPGLMRYSMSKLKSLELELQNSI